MGNKREHRLIFIGDILFQTESAFENMRHLFGAKYRDAETHHDLQRLDE